jgi:hypothetical protein
LWARKSQSRHSPSSSKAPSSRDSVADPRNWAFQLVSLSLSVTDKANIDDKHCEDSLTESGIYYGYAKVYEGDKQVEEMVMSVGYNPFYNNTVRSAVRTVLYSADQRKYIS